MMTLVPRKLFGTRMTHQRHVKRGIGHQRHFSRVVVVFWVGLSLWVALSFSSWVVGETSRLGLQSNYCTCQATLSV